MDATQLAAVLAGLVVLASIISVELGLSVALIELGLGVIGGNLFSLDPNTDWLVFIASFASIVLTFLAGAEVDPDDFRERFGASVWDRPGLVRRPVRRRRPGRLRGARLDAQGRADRRHRAVDDLAGRRLRGAGRDRAEHDPDRQADHERLLRHRHGDGDRPVGDLHQAQRLVSGLPGRLARADRRPAEDRAVVLPPLRRPRDRARDQADLRLPLRADGPRRRWPRATRCCPRSSSAW